MHMLRFTGALLVGAVLALTASAAPRGRVVRVERPRTCAPVTPVICFEIRPDGGATCLGPQPKDGDIIVVLDETAVFAEVKVDSATKAPGVNCDVVWKVNGTVLKGDVSSGKRSKTMGLIDNCVDRQAARRLPEDKIVKPTADTRVEIGFDRDGDGQADMLVAQGTCPGAGTECIEYWSRRSKGLERVWSTSLRACGP